MQTLNQAAEYFGRNPGQNFSHAYICKQALPRRKKKQYWKESLQITKDQSKQSLRLEHIQVFFSFFEIYLLSNITCNYASFG